MITRKQSQEYWKQISQERARKRKEKLASGKLIIGLDKNGKPIVIPVDQPILTLAERFHKLAEDKT